MSTNNSSRNHNHELGYITDLNKFKGFKLINLNIRSLLPKINLLRLDLIDTDIDVFTLNETWLKPNISDGLLTLKNYCFVRSDRSTLNQNGDLKPGGGLGIYFNPDYVCSVIESLRYCTDDIECFVITLTKNLYFKAVIINFYRPPAGSVKRAIDYLDFVLDYISTNFKNYDVYLAGDINLNLLTCNSYTKLFVDMCVQYSIYNLINQPTRVTQHKATLIDICATSCSEIYAAGIIKYSLSDHFMTFCCKKRARNDKGKERVKMKIRSYKNYDPVAMSTSLKCYNWGKFYGTRDVDEAWQLMFEQLLVHADFYAPYTCHYIRDNQPGWFNLELLDMTIERDRLFDKANKSKDKKDYKCARRKSNEVKTAVTNARSEYYLDHIKKNAGNPKKFWNDIHELTSTSKSNKILSVKNPESGKLVDTKETVGLINNFFSKVGKNLDNNLPAYTKTYLFPNVGSRLYYSPDVTVDMIDELIDNIDLSKASGCRFIPTRIYKDGLKALHEQLAHLFNLSISTGKVPLAWKAGVVTPLPKKGDSSVLNNIQNHQPCPMGSLRGPS